VVRGRARHQAGNSLLVDLEQSASSCLAQVVELREGDRTSGSRRRVRVRREPRASPAPLAPGRIHRVSFRRTASADIGPPAGGGLFLLPGLLVACGRDRTLALDPAGGAERWSAPGAIRASAGDGRVALLRADAIEVRDAATGAVLWSRRPPEAGPGSSLALVPRGQLLVSSGATVSAFDPAGGQPLWSFTSPGAARVRLLPLGDLLVVASDGGMLHALDPAGHVAWRLRGAGPLATPPVGTSRSCLFAFVTPNGATLAAVDPATGERRFESSLDFAPDGPPLRVAGRIVIAGRVAGDGVLAALEEDGSHAWTEPSPTGGIPALAPRPGGLLAKGPDGSCAALDRDGRTLWLRSAEGRPSPPGNLPPVAVRGLVLVAAEEVEWLDGTTGRPVGRVPAHAPARLAVGDDLATWTLDGDGLLSGARVRGHLAVVG
jgi:outer membrane protein assembly factor BamB